MNPLKKVLVSGKSKPSVHPHPNLLNVITKVLSRTTQVVRFQVREPASDRP